AVSLGTLGSLAFSGSALATNGVWANVRNAQTANYTAAASDCGKTIALGGNAFFTLTVSATGTYTANDPQCVIVIKNEDTARGKALSVSGLPSLQPILWPQQTVTLFVQNAAWAVDRLRQRWRWDASYLLHVGSAGNDANDGLAAGAGNAL